MFISVNLYSEERISIDFERGGINGDAGKVANAYTSETYELDGVTYTLVDKRAICCDQGATLYNEDGEKVCEIIGISGQWLKKCEEFAYQVLSSKRITEPVH